MVDTLQWGGSYPRVSVFSRELSLPYNIHLNRKHHPNLAPKEVQEQKFRIIQYCELQQPSIYRQKLRYLYMGVGPLSTIDVVQSKDTDNTSTWTTKDKETTNRCYMSHRQLLSELGTTNGVTSFSLKLYNVLSEAVSIHASPRTHTAGNFSASSQLLTRSRHFLASLYQLHSSLNTRSTCSYTVRFFYPCSALSDVRVHESFMW